MNYCDRLCPIMGLLPDSQIRVYDKIWGKNKMRSIGRGRSEGSGVDVGFLDGKVMNFIPRR